MNRDRFWLTDGQFSNLEPHLPTDTRGKDKGYDANAIRRQVEERGATPNISRKADRKRGNCFSPFHYCNRSAIERATEAPSSACFAG